MRFAFDEEQLAFRDSVRDLLAATCPPSALRAAWSAPPGQLDRAPWDGLWEMGVMHVLVPETHGGLGLDFCSLVLVLEETGRAGLPHPIVETAAVAAPLRGAALDAALTAATLGGPVVAAAVDAELFLVEEEDALRLVDTDDVVLEPVDTVDGARRAARVRLRGPGAGTVLGHGPEALAAAHDRGALGVAAQLVGLAATMLDLVVAHVKDRHQFGVPIGSFQAVKHHLADALTELSFARPAVHRAAHSIAHDVPTRRRDVALAKAMASDAAWSVSRAALQCHGALGYTVEHDLQLYMKRTWALAASWGSAREHRRRLADAMGLPGAAAR